MMISCNTGGVNGKQGGFFWDYCANVTINPNPEGCSSDKQALTYELLESEYQQLGMEVVTHVATDAEHEAAMIVLLKFDPSLNSSALADTDTATDVEKRDSTDCYSHCRGIDRDVALEAVAWFCNKYGGTEIDNPPDSAGPVSFAAN